MAEKKISRRNIHLFIKTFLHLLRSRFYFVLLHYLNDLVNLFDSHGFLVNLFGFDGFQSIYLVFPLCFCLKQLIVLSKKDETSETTPQLFSQHNTGWCSLDGLVRVNECAVRLRNPCSDNAMIGSVCTELMQSF